MNRIMTLLVAALLAQPVFAEPSRTVDWLMDEPPSMFDFGMLRLRQANDSDWTPKLQESMKSGKFELEEESNGVVYDFDKNEIVIEVSFIGQADEQVCRDILRLYRDILDPPRLRKNSPEMANAFLANEFDHINYDVTAYPQHWEKDIAGIMIVTVGIKEPTPPPVMDESPVYAALRELAGGKSIFCSTPILEYDVSYRKFGN